MTRVFLYLPESNCTNLPFPTPSLLPSYSYSVGFISPEIIIFRTNSYPHKKTKRPKKRKQKSSVSRLGLLYIRHLCNRPERSRKPCDRSRCPLPPTRSASLVPRAFFTDSTKRVACASCGSQGARNVRMLNSKGRIWGTNLSRCLISILFVIRKTLWISNPGDTGNDPQEN